MSTVFFLHSGISPLLSLTMLPCSHSAHIVVGRTETETGEILILILWSYVCGLWWARDKLLLILCLCPVRSWRRVKTLSIDGTTSIDGMLETLRRCHWEWPSCHQSHTSWQEHWREHWSCCVVWLQWRRRGAAKVTCYQHQCFDPLSSYAAQQTWNLCQEKQGSAIHLNIQMNTIK